MCLSVKRLISRIKEIGSPVVAGLDPLLEHLPSFIKEKAYRGFGRTPEGAAEAILEFNMGLIDALCDVVPAVKPQCAYYELYGWQGMRALARTISYARSKGLYVITDGKRNDIGPTAAAYAAAYLGYADIDGEKVETFGSDALTVNGYLGSDGVAPFLKECTANNRMVFILAKTSNPSSGELQDRLVGGVHVYELIGQMAELWGNANGGGYTDVGLVVGATYPAQLASMRSRFPNTFFLVPGYGAQGAGAADVAAAFDENGLGALINSSRAIMCAYRKEGCPEEDYAGAARREALRMRDEILAAVSGRKG